MATILLVDDNDDIREVLRVMLETRGYAVAEATNGAGALRYLLHGGAPSAVVLDLRMPAMSGHDLYETMKRDPRFASIPIIVFSALNDDGRLPGAAAYVRKAVDPDALLQAIDEACRAPAA